MEIGDLDKRIYLLEPIKAASALGGSKVSSYRPVTRVWANRRDENSGLSEGAEGPRVAAIGLVSWLIRRPRKWMPTPLWRVKGPDGGEYNIIHVAEIDSDYLALKTRRHDG